MEIKLTLPIPPTANHIWKKSGSRFYLSPEYEKFKKEVVRIWQESGQQSLSSRLEMGVILHFKNKRRSDISNRIKALEDSLKKHAFEDDEQIDVIFVKRGSIQKDGACVVMIREIV